MNRTSAPEGSFSFSLQQQTLWLLPQKAIYWRQASTLLLADLHLGKAGHFRKSGIPVPAAIHQDDLQTLLHLIETLRPERILLLGDLFHSQLNNEWHAFTAFLAQHTQLPFVLIKGNHDILPEEAYHIANLQVVDEYLLEAPFCLTHKPTFAIPSVAHENFYSNSQYPAYYNLAGHIHPGVQLQDTLGSPLRMPCFYFREQGGLLPAFGRFTGYKCLPASHQCRIFGIAGLGKSRARVLQIR